MSLLLEQLDRDIVATKKSISDLEPEVETAKALGDPMPLLKAKSALRQAYSNLSVLAYRRRCETPAGGGGDGRPGGGYFSGSNF
jgi:hypothetical protein